MSQRKSFDQLFRILSRLGSALAVFVLLVLIAQILRDGLPRLEWDFLSRFPSRSADKAGLYTALVGSFYLMLITILISVPAGIATALYLEEYQKKGWIKQLLQINISSLAGMPSILYGLLGLTLFARLAGLERSLITGALTLSLMSLPVIIVAAQGAIRAVPKSIRDAAYALGARKHQVVLGQVLPAAIPGIVTGAWPSTRSPPAARELETGAPAPSSAPLLPVASLGSLK